MSKHSPITKLFPDKFVPYEIICRIMEYLDRKDFLVLRLVSRSWTRTSSMYMKGLDEPLVKLFDTEMVTEFTKLMKKCESNPFPGYDIITFPTEWVDKISRDLSTKLTKLRLSNSYDDTTEHIRLFLEKFQHVEKLWIEVTDTETDPVVLPNNTNFSNLSFLSITNRIKLQPTHYKTFKHGFNQIIIPKPPREPPQHIQFEVLWDAFLRLSSLETLKTDSFLPLKDVKHFLFRFLKGLEKSNLKCFSAGIRGNDKARIQKVAEDWDHNVNGNLGFYWKKVWARSLDVDNPGFGRLMYLKIELGAVMNITLPQLPHLEIILIKFSSGGSEISNFEAAQFPSLKRVGFNFGGDLSRRMTQPFSTAVFPTVDTLQLENPGTVDGMSGDSLWHNIFPNLKTYSIENPTASDKSYIVSHLKNIENLKLNYTSGNHFEQIFRRNQDTAWPFAHLKDLQAFEIGFSVDSYSTKACTAIYYWTVTEQIQKLKYLGIYDLPKEAELKAKRNFAISPWHKRVAYQRPLRSPPWSNI